jgi:hypothetical protein
VRVRIYSNKTFREIYNRKGYLSTKYHRLVGAVQLGAVLLTDEIDKTLYVFNMTGERVGQLKLPDIDIHQGPRSAAIDNQMLYLGMEDGSIHILTLTKM